MLPKVKNKKSHLRQYFCLGSFLKQSYRYVLWFKIDLGCAEPRRKFSEAERKKSYHNSGEAGTELPEERDVHIYAHTLRKGMCGFEPILRGYVRFSDDFCENWRGVCAVLPTPI